MAGQLPYLDIQNLTKSFGAMSCFRTYRSVLPKDRK